MSKVWKWIRRNYNAIVNSIAFYPAIISGCFLLLSFLMITLDFSELGKNLKSKIGWVSLQDATTARSIVSSIAAGVITLTVFSFSMVMIVLNQAASQMSNRILDTMIGNKFQQMVLGIYIGTIVYALFLLSTIRDVQSGIHVPAMSIYLLVLLMVIDIFLFIYFLHYVTQTVKYETIIQRIQKKTHLALKDQNHSTELLKVRDGFSPATALPAIESGYFQGYDEKQLLEFATEKRVVLEFLFSKGSYMIKGSDMMIVHGPKLSDEDVDEMMLAIDFFDGQAINLNPYFGFQQLSEVAVKALSPGINDGATAVSSIYALSDLLAFYINEPTCAMVCDNNLDVWIITKEKSFEDLVHQYLLPVWHYGKCDPFVQRSLYSTIGQLKQIDTKQKHWGILNRLLIEIEKQIASNDIHHLS